MPSLLRSSEPVPNSLDHILLGVDDLDRGVAFVEEHLGVRAMFGGVHPGRGTRNALLSLGAGRYLEIIAPDPAQTRPLLLPQLTAMRDPRLVGWAVHTSDITAVAAKLRRAGLAFDGPEPGSRARPNGKTLRWKALRLKDDRGGILPFFIEWDHDTLHPSADAPAGCALAKFSAAGPSPAQLAGDFLRLGIEITVERGAALQLHAQITGPETEFQLLS